MRERRVQSFNVLQQRLNRKSVTPKLLAEFPAHLRAYDLLIEGEEDLRELPLTNGAPTRGAVARPGEARTMSRRRSRFGSTISRGRAPTGGCGR
jgi:DNA ligase-1